MGPGDPSGLWGPGALEQQLCACCSPTWRLCHNCGANQDFHPSSAFPGCLLCLLKLWCVLGRNRVGGGVLNCEGAEENRGRRVHGAVCPTGLLLLPLFILPPGKLFVRLLTSSPTFSCIFLCFSICSAKKSLSIPLGRTRFCALRTRRS